MARLVRIHLRSAVQTFRGLGKISRAAIYVEQLEQSLAVVALAIRRVEQFAEELQHFRRSPPRCRQLLHRCQKLPALAPLCLELAKLARQRDRSRILLTLLQLSNQ